LYLCFRLHLYWLLWCDIFIFCLCLLFFYFIHIHFVSFYRFCQLISLKTFPTEYYFFLRFSSFIFRWHPFSSFLPFSILESRDGCFLTQSFDCSLRKCGVWGPEWLAYPLCRICLIIFIFPLFLCFYFIPYVFLPGFLLFCFKFIDFSFVSIMLVIWLMLFISRLLNEFLLFLFVIVCAILLYFRILLLLFTLLLDLNGFPSLFYSFISL